uniref:Uncharacterized protein n=1 Tax=Physcomitrium patens TaxID=3218 RepID=A0A2K1KJF4_PHYPA|nr:hypothetical protein PHYPA_007583 [Physcomitrium patens]
MAHLHSILVLEEVFWGFFSFFF